MSEATLEKAVCKKCGAPIRDNTLFCYSCGSPVAEGQTLSASDSNGFDLGVDAETKAALDDLAEKMSATESTDSDKLAKAAAERKKARVSGRRSIGFVWEPRDDTSSRMVLLLAVLIAVIAAAVVFLIVFLR